MVTVDPIILPSFHFVSGTHTETSTERRAARPLTCTSSTEMSTKRKATRASRIQSGVDTQRGKSTNRKATINPKIQSGLGTESESSTEYEATRAPLIQPGEFVHVCEFYTSS